jgi:hypothetical protein
VVAIAAVCALLVAAAIAAAWPGGPARVCVSSAAASVGPDGTVAETTSPVECDPAGPTP